LKKLEKHVGMKKTTKIILNLSTCSATAHALELLEEAKLTISLD
jgi:hypothetical protein